MMTRYHCTDTLAFAVRDSLNKIEALKADSLKKIATKENADSLHKVIDKNKDDIQRLTPEEMNRRRTGTHREKKPEQIQVEQHIQKGTDRAKKRTPDESTQAATTKTFKQLIVMKRFCFSLFADTCRRIYEAAGEWRSLTKELSEVCSH